MKRLLTFLVIMLSCVSLMAAYLEDVPVTLTQPDGTEIKCFASGDEYYNWYHDANDFTIIANSNGYYCYAILSDDKVVASPYLVGSVDPATVGIKPGVIISAEARNQLRKQLLANTPSTRPVRDGYAPAKDAKHQGVMNNLVVYIYFNDQEPFSRDTTYYWQMFNDNTTIEEQSMKNYFYDVSYNQFTINSSFYPLTETSTIMAYQDIHPREYYMPFDEQHPLGYRNESQRTDREFQLLHDAIEYIADMVPEDLNIDYNNDGYVDNVCFIIKGDVTAWATLLWPHRWALYSNFAYIHGKQVYDFNFQLESSLDDSKSSVLCHEMFHSLGSPDLYRYNNNNIEPVGYWDVMAGNANPAQSMAVYMKKKYGGWVDEIPEITEGGRYTLNPVYVDHNNAYIIASPNSSEEYFLLEYRNKRHPFESGLPGEGLLIYRVYPQINGNADGPPDELYVFRPGGTNTNTNGTIKNAGFSADAGRTEFSDTTNPPCFLRNNAPGGICIKNIGHMGGTISFDVYMDGVPDATFTASDTLVTVGCPVDFTGETYSFVDNWFWDFEDATPAASEEQNPTGIKFNSPGYKTVTLTVMNDKGDKTIVKEQYIYVSEDAPFVDFTSDVKAICEAGQTVRFYDNSTLCPESWNWSFEPNTVTFIEETSAQSQNPVVVFNDFADYSVTLTVNNVNGSNQKTVTNYFNSNAIDVLDYVVDFENISSFEEIGWKVENPDNSKTWELVNTLDDMGTNTAAYVNMNNYNAIDRVDYLISPCLNIDGLYTMHFRHAYRLKRSDVSDSLIVSISTDCGATWNVLEKFYEDGNNNFVTGAPTTYDFVPYRNNQWCGSQYSDCKSVDLSEYAGVKNAYIRFESVKIVGNNMFIDDIYFTSEDGIVESDKSGNLRMYPNPTTGKFVLKSDIANNNAVVSIYNLLGECVYSAKLVGTDTEIDLSGCPAGFYIVNVRGDKMSESLKLVKK